MKYFIIGFLCLIGLAFSVYVFFPGLLYRGGIQALRVLNGLERHEVVVGDLRWAYLDGGQGETILLLHGFGADKDRWGLFPRPLTRSFRVIIPDLPGFGESTKRLAEDYGIPSQVRRLDRFVEALGLETFHLAGTSMGGYIAGCYAGDYPDKTRSLFLMDPAGVGSPIPSDGWRLYQEEERNLLLYRNAAQFDELMAYLFYRPPWIPERIKRHVIQNVSTDYGVRKKIVQDLLEDGLYLLEDRLGNIRTRSLVLWGRQDRVIHVSAADKFKKGIRDCDVLILDQCGHIPFYEKRRETQEAYINFLKKQAYP